MNNDDSNKFETKLLEKRRNITGIRSAIANSAEDANPEYGRDEGDRANASQAKEMTWLRTAHERQLLEMIDGALSRIHDGTFGQCLHCGQEVGMKRLTAIPWTRYCITCQELLEQYGS